MKTRMQSGVRKHWGSQMPRFRQAGVLLLSMLCGMAIYADDTNSPPAMTPQEMFEGGTKTYNNWIELSAGGFITDGNAAQAEEVHHLSRGAFGGIESLHFEHPVGTNNLNLTIDGRSIFDDHDYSLSLQLKHPDLWYLRVGFENFRTWYNDDGGYYPPTGTQYSHTGDALALDRGQVTFEAGLSLKKLPKLTFKYTHRYRDGDKSSTSWGPLHPDIGADPALVRGVYPSFYSIDEHVDTFELNATHHIKSTDLGLGLRYEIGDLNDSRYMTSWQGEPVQQKTTDRSGTSYDMFSVHAFSETWIKENLFFSSGFLYENLDSTLSGSRISGDDFDIGYSPGTLSGLGYYSLNGGAHQNDYVMDLNLMAKPTKTFTITPSIRVQKEDMDANSAGIGTLGVSSAPFSARSDRESLDVRERLDFRYIGFTNWVLYASGEWTEGDGNLKETNGLSQIGGIGVPAIQRNTDDSRFFQKYSAGARWYPASRVSVDVGGYYKNNDYDYNNLVDSTPNNSGSANRYPAYLTMQGFETYDGNLRLTLRPFQNVTLVSRYEYQLSTVRTTPDPASGLGGIDSSRMTSHIIGQNASWIPWKRLSLQAGFNYVLSETKSPVSGGTSAAVNAADGAGYTQAILNSQNNYWTVNFNSGIVVDDKTDLNLGYFYYQSANYNDTSAVDLPLGAASKEHGVTATLTRRIRQNVRLNLKYGFFTYDDQASGGHNNYDAHVIYSSLQYRF